MSELKEQDRTKNNNLAESVKILIVDDHTIIRRGLKFILETNFGLTGFMETDSCNGVKELIAKNNFTHIILDMQLNDGNAIEILSDLISNHPDTRILIYTMSPEEVFALRLLNMGVAGFINKQSSEKELVIALNDFLNGNVSMSAALKNQLQNKSTFGKTEDPFSQLSERELTVMSYLIKGEGIKEISTRLNIKSSTVATFKARIYNKLGISNIIDLKNLIELYPVKQPAP